MSEPRQRREGGTAPLELALGVGLLMIPMALIALSFGPVLEMRSFVRQAAAEISRSFVISDGDVATAMTQVAIMAVNHGFEPSEVRVGLCGAVPVPVSSGGASACPVPLQRRDVVTARVEMDVPLITVPGLGATIETSGPVSAEHRSLVDWYRSVS